MGVSGSRESSAGREGMDVKVSAISSSDGFATTYYGNGHIHCQAPGDGAADQAISLGRRSARPHIFSRLTSETLSDLQMSEAAPMCPKGASPRRPGEPRACVLA
jgi:hypothetical protein